MTDTNDVDVTVEPALPGLELPEYHGRTPSGMKTSINGAGNRLTRAHGIGDRVVLVVEAKVRKAGHEEDGDGALVYVEALKAADIFEITGDPGRRLLATVRQAYRTSDDERGGRRALEDLTGEVSLGTAGVTDASGVVLTEAELAELRGDDPVRAMLDDERTPVVVVFSDGGRELWPDEFAAGERRPRAGQQFGVEGDLIPVYVAELLHAETGETLAAWSEEDEAGRLKTLEELAARAEAAEDREAHEQLMRARAEAQGERMADDDPDICSTCDGAGTIGGPGDDWTDPAADAEARAERGLDHHTHIHIPREPDPGDPVDAEHGLAPEQVADAYANDDDDDQDDDVSDLGDGLQDLGDGLEPFEREEPALPGEDDDRGADVVELGLPTADDFALVDCTVPTLIERLGDVTDLDRLRRLRKAELQGRGRGLQPRRSAVEAIDVRFGQLNRQQQEVGTDGVA